MLLFIWKISYINPMSIDHILLPLLFTTPETAHLLLNLLSSFLLLMTSESNKCCPCVYKCVTSIGAWAAYQWPHSQRRMIFPLSLRRHKLPISSVRGMGHQRPLSNQTRNFNWLNMFRSWIGNHCCCMLICVTGMPSLEVRFSQFSSPPISTTLFLSTLLWSFLRFGW